MNQKCSIRPRPARRNSLMPGPLGTEDALERAGGWKAAETGSRCFMRREEWQPSALEERMHDLLRDARQLRARIEEARDRVLGHELRKALVDSSSDAR